jgi:LuxR family transcriptional regulator, maltose regulon positive regulatory protein
LFLPAESDRYVSRQHQKVLVTRHNKSKLVLLQAKLNRPRVTKNLIVRPRLLTSLDESLSEPVSIVVSPAGFGKTTLVSSWIEELAAGRRPGTAPLPAVWLSLDEGDSDLNIFLRYFVHALRTIYPDAAPRTLELLSARQPPPDVLADTLSNEIEALASDFIMVLDDVHVLSGRGVFDFLSAWMPHWPRPMHLVIVSRLIPSLPIADLRAKGNLVEVRSHDLRFTLTETADYLNHRLGYLPAESTVATLYDQLEGWVTGLQLATLASDAGDRLSDLSQEVLSGEVHITNFLMNEVLLRQPAQIQRFLLKISITNEFCEPLCMALLGDEEPGCDVRACLDYLETNELFLIALDNRQEWYRLHQLFRDLLRRRLRLELGQEGIDALHIRAARWYAQKGFLDQAINHALEGRNPTLAGEIIRQGLGDVLNRTDRPVLERWIKLLPEELISKRPELLVMQAWAHGLRWEIAQGQRVLEQVEALLGEDWLASATDETATLIGQVAALKAHHAYNAGQFESAVTFSREGLRLLPPDWRYARGVAAGYLGLSLYATGQIAEAERFLTTRYEAVADQADTYSLRLLNMLALNTLQQGLFESAKRTAMVLLSQSEQADIAVMRGWAHYLLGHLHYEWNELDLAEQSFLATLDMRYTTQLLVARNGFIGLAAVYQAKGESAKAMATIDELSQFDLELYGQELISTTAARARLLLRQGDLPGAGLSSEQIDLTLPPPLLLPWTEQPFLTRICILIARNTPEDITAALKALELLEDLALRTFSSRSRVEILALRALAQLSQGDAVTARETLIRSVELARRSKQIRVFVDLGPPMQILMEQIAGHRAVSSTVGTILAAFESPNDGSSRGSGRFRTAAPVLSLAETLTARELEILKLMTEPLSLTQISEKLDVSPATVKRHSINLYEKLGVHTRWKAVAKAIELGILPPR